MQGIKVLQTKNTPLTDITGKRLILQTALKSTQHDTVTVYASTMTSNRETKQPSTII